MIEFGTIFLTEIPLGRKSWHRVKLPSWPTFFWIFVTPLSVGGFFACRTSKWLPHQGEEFQLWRADVRPCTRKKIIKRVLAKQLLTHISSGGNFEVEWIPMSVAKNIPARWSEIRQQSPSCECFTLYYSSTKAILFPMVSSLVRESNFSKREFSLTKKCYRTSTIFNDPGEFRRSSSPGQKETTTNS